MRYVTYSMSTEHIEQQSNRATEHSTGHVTHRSAVLVAGRDEHRRIRTHCLGHHYKNVEIHLPVRNNSSIRNTSFIQNGFFISKMSTTTTISIPTSTKRTMPNRPFPLI